MAHRFMPAMTSDLWFVRQYKDKEETLKEEEEMFEELQRQIKEYDSGFTAPGFDKGDDDEEEDPEEMEVGDESTEYDDTEDA
mmetsp:Transcript_37737/g.42745  ORF Transcript_37737/g.42745 Transcript_37737/m.42745 type:complete len:82 (+) Transcript_37737:22-267(+)